MADVGKHLCELGVLRSLQEWALDMSFAFYISCFKSSGGPYCNMGAGSVSCGKSLH